MYCIKYVHGDTWGSYPVVGMKSVRCAIAYLEDRGFRPEWYEQDRKLPHSFVDDRGNRALILKEEELDGYSS